MQTPNLHCSIINSKPMEPIIKLDLFLLLCLLSQRYCHGTTVVSDFIHSSCQMTKYPTLCEQTLSGSSISRRSPRLIAQEALSVSLTHAQSAFLYTNHLSDGAITTLDSHENGVIQDCVSDMSNSVDLLQRSVGQMRRMGRANSPAFAYRLSNVQTWASAALTDLTTCVDSFEDSGLKPETKVAMRRRVVRVSKIIANALALVNRIAPTDV